MPGMLLPLQTLLSPWQLQEGASEALEGSPALATAWEDGPVRRKTNHEAGETNAEPALPSKGRGVSWQC